MADSTALWHAEHVRFSRLLDLLEEQVAEFHEGECPDLDLMRDVVSYLREFGDRFHHPREDAAFARMVMHDQTLRLPINRLLQEHRAIAVAGEELVTRLNEIIADVVIVSFILCPSLKPVIAGTCRDAARAWPVPGTEP